MKKQSIFKKFIFFLVLSLVILFIIRTKQKNIERQVQGPNQLNKPMQYVKYTPKSKYLTMSILDNSVKMTVPTTLISAIDSIDCYTGYMLPKGSELLVSFDRYGYVVPSESQSIPIELQDKDSVLQHAAGCTIFPPTIFNIRKLDKTQYDTYIQETLKENRGKVLDNKEEKMKVGNIDVLVRVLKVEGFEPDVGLVLQPRMLYLFQFKNNYYEIENTIFSEYNPSSIDSALLKETADYILNHLEFK